MATVYSLVCWGGLAGKSVTGAVATDILTYSGNSILRIGTAVVAQSTVSGVTAGTTYYARPISATTFYLYDTLSNAQAGGATGRIDITATTAFYLKSKAMIDYLAAYSDRWGVSGSERVYDTIGAWNTARTAAYSPLDEEVCELGEALTESLASGSSMSITVASGSVRIESMVDGARTSAFHNGSVSASATYYGYVIEHLILNTYSLVLSGRNQVADGFTIYRPPYGGYPPTGVLIQGLSAEARNMISVGTNGQGSGFMVWGAMCKAKNCIAKGYGNGFQLNNSTDGLEVSGCTAVGNGVGFYGLTSYPTYAYVYNNVALGNTTNWLAGVNGLRSATNNAGGTGEAWMTTGGSRIEITESTPFSGTFADYTNLNYRPASVTSKLVDTGVEFYGAVAKDIVDTFRPAYSGSAYGTAVAAGSFVAGLSYTIASVGTTDFTAIGASTNTVGVTFKATGAGTGTGTATLNAKYDIGAYEFDLGYGEWPASTTVTFDGVNAGSEIRVYDSGGAELAGVESCSADHALTWAVASGDQHIVIVHLDYRIKDFSYTNQAGAQTLPVQQEPDDWYSNPA
jgi:hypothetical protein